MTGQSTLYVGHSLRRQEDRKFLTGKGRYVDDIALPGMLYLAILRSPHAHARITGIDLSAAKASAGVRLALDGADLVGKIGDIKPNWVIPGTVVPPSSFSPCRNPATSVEFLAVRPPAQIQSTRGTFADCCALAAGGHAPAAPEARNAAAHSWSRSLRRRCPPLFPVFIARPELAPSM